MRQQDPLRALGEDERSVLEHLSRSRREPAAVVARALGVPARSAAAHMAPSDATDPLGVC